MFDYSNLTKKDLVSDVESTFKKSSTLILEIKNSEIPEIMMFDSFERIIEDLSGRVAFLADVSDSCLLYTSPSPRDRSLSRMPSSA